MNFKNNIKYNFQFNIANISIFKYLYKNEILGSTSLFFSKKTVKKEVQKLINHGILQLSLGNFYIINKEYKKWLENLDFSVIKPYPKKMNNQSLDILIYLYYLSKFKKSINFQKLKVEFSQNNFQSNFKNILYTNDFVEFYDVQQNIVSSSSIFKSEYNIQNNIGKQMLFYDVCITEKGKKYLEDKNLVTNYQFKGIPSDFLQKEINEVLSFFQHEKHYDLIDIYYSSTQKVLFIFEFNMSKNFLKTQKKFNNLIQKFDFIFEFQHKTHY